MNSLNYEVLRNTEKLYYKDQYLAGANTQVTRVHSDGIELQSTVAYPEGGGQEADVGAAAFDDPGRRRRAEDGLILLELDHRSPVVEHDRAAGALGEAVAVLVANDLEVVRGEPLRFRCSQFDDLDRNPCGIEERQAVITGLGRLRGRAPGVGRDRAFDRCRRRSRLFRCQHLAQTHLAAGGIDDPPFALRAEDLTLKPVKLMLGGRQFAAQFDNLLRSISRRLIKAENTGRGRRIHAAIIP